jgi:hypothetical protein
VHAVQGSWVSSWTHPTPFNPVCVCVCVCVCLCLSALLLPPVPLPYHLTAVLSPTQLAHPVWLLASTVRGGGVWSIQCLNRSCTGNGAATRCMHAPCISTPPPASSCRPAAAPGHMCKATALLIATTLHSSHVLPCAAFCRPTSSCLQRYRLPVSFLADDVCLQAQRSAASIICPLTPNGAPGLLVQPQPHQFFFANTPQHTR